MLIENVTDRMNETLAKHHEIRSAIGILASSYIFGRETRSAALGEISEHLIAAMVRGKRHAAGSKGCDVIDEHGGLIEVKSRLIGRWGDGLMFDFSSHTERADRVFCVAWNDQSAQSSIYEAYTMPVSALVMHWGNSKLRRHCARTTLKKLRQAWEAERSYPGVPDSLLHP